MPQPENAPDSPGAEISHEPHASDGPAVIGGRYEVDFSECLNYLDSPQAHAYGARDLEGGSRHRFALVLTRNSYVRFARFADLNAVYAGGMLRMFAHGSITLPNDEGQRMALIMERPLGGRVMIHNSKAPDRLDERDIIDRILVPIEDSLRAFHRAGLTYRAVRPDNMFFRDMAGGPAGLGECLSAPPGFDQPDSFEPIESAMASPAGRGDGTAASDMFALGVTIVTLLNGRWPAKLHQPKRILRRINRGSYRELTGRVNCSHDMEELLAGLLYDDPETRWNVDQLRAWLNHKSVGRRPFQPVKSAVRPFKVEDLSCSLPRAAAYALSCHANSARNNLANGELTRWLERSLGNIHLADVVGAIVGDGMDDDISRPKINEKVVSRICRMLDPGAPVYFHGAAPRWETASNAASMK